MNTEEDLIDLLNKIILELKQEFELIELIEKRKQQRKEQLIKVLSERR